MSYQQQGQQGVHRLTEFVPTYVPHSDYLPNRVVDANQPEAQQWVSVFSCRFPTMSNKDVQERSIPNALLILTPPDMSLSEPTRTSYSASPSLKLNSTAESRGFDRFSNLHCICIEMISLNHHKG